MNLFQSANGAATFLVLGATGFGTANAIKATNEPIVELAMENPSLPLLIFFLIAFKIKTALDDHKHFGEPYQFKTIFRYIGFFLAFFSWFFMALSGYFIGSPLRATELLGYALAISTLWVFVHLMEIWRAKERPSTELIISLIREKWVVVNILYILCIITYSGWLSPIIESENWYLLASMLVILLFDVVTSRSFKNIS